MRHTSGAKQDIPGPHHQLHLAKGCVQSALYQDQNLMKRTRMRRWFPAKNGADMLETVKFDGLKIHDSNILKEESNSCHLHPSQNLFY